MPRPADPDTALRLSVYKNGRYVYACTQPGMRDPATGALVYRRLSWGRLEDGLRFIPGPRWLRASPEERRRLIVPEDWDMSLAEAADAAPQGAVQAAGDAQEELNLLYGHVMLCEHAARECGLCEDLLEAFAGDRERCALLLALACYLPCSGDALDHARQWQQVMKLPTQQDLSPACICRFLQSVTAAEQAALMQACLRRMPPGTLLAVDSTTRAAYGAALAEVRAGRSRERVVRPQTVEVVAYDLSQHLPVYYRTMQGNIPDSRTLETIISDLHGYAAPAVRDVILVTDRGYASLHNFRVCMERGQPFLTAVKTAQSPVLPCLMELGSFDFKPQAMDFDPRSGLCYKQYDLSAWAGEKKLPAHGRLHLNLYLDPAQRCREQAAIYAELAQQSEVLQELQGTCLSTDERAALQDGCRLFAPTYDADTSVLSGFVPDEDELTRRRLTAGFFASITYGLEWDALQAYRSYKLRDDQEKYFASMLGQLDGRCQRTWTQRSRSGREMLLFAAGRILSWLNHARTSTLSDAAGCRACSSLPAMLGEMRAVRYVQHAGGTPFLTPLVGQQSVICRALGIRPSEHLSWLGAVRSAARKGRAGDEQRISS